MLTNVVTKMQLDQALSWRPESFFDGESVRFSSPFRLERLGILVDERRQTIEPQEEANQEIHYLGLENVEPITGRLLDVKLRRSREIKSRSKVFQANDILYGRLRAYLNKVYVATTPVSEGICSTEFLVLRPLQSKVRPVFLRALLSSEYVLNNIVKWQTGSALPRVSLAALLDLEVPLPPMQTQLAYEKELIEQAKRQIALAEELSALPKRLMQSLSVALREGAERLDILSDS